VKYCLCSISFRHELVSFNELLNFGSKVGIDGIELWSVHARSIRNGYQPYEIEQQLNRRNMKVSMLSGYVDFNKSIAEMEADLRELIVLAKIFRTDKLRLFAGAPDNGRQMCPRVKCVGALQRFCEIAEKEHCFIVIETHPGTYADSLDETTLLLKEVNHTNLKINLDLLHLWEADDDPVQSVRELSDVTVNYHLKNIQSIEQLSVFHPSQVYSPFGVRDGITALEDGLIKYEPILEEIKRHNSNSYLALEWFGERPFDYCRNQMNWLKRWENLHAEIKVTAL